MTAQALFRKGRLEGISGRVEESLEGVLAPFEGLEPSVVALDVPMGLPDIPARGGRAAERAARARLGARASSVFSTPCRPALERARAKGFALEAYAEVAKAQAEASAEGLGLSKQSYFILPRIDEVDQYLRSHPKDRDRIFEVHPELSFSAMTEGKLPPKKSFRGKLARLEGLRGVGLDVPSALLALEDHPLANADDVLDACACLWSAARIARGRSECLPLRPPPEDRFGIRMAIFF